MKQETKSLTIDPVSTEKLKSDIEKMPQETRARILQQMAQRTAAMKEDTAA